MANRTWTLGNGSSATGNWSTPADWSSKSVPASNDSVSLIGNNTSNYTVTLDTSQPASGSYAALTVGIAKATLALSVANETLSVSGSTTLNAGNINISNTATLATGTFVVANPGNFAQGNGLLSVTGTGATALSVTGGTFGLSGGAVAVTNGASFAGGTSTISGGTFTASSIAIAGGAVIQSGGTTTLSGALTLSTGSIAINNAAATLNVASLAMSGDTFSQSNGTIGVSGLANFIAGTDTISGGAFNAGALTLGKDTAVPRTLTLSGGVTTVTNTTTISAATAVGGSKVIMSGASLAALGGISFTGASDRGTLSGNGTVSGGAISGLGTITASGGTLDIGNAISSGPTLTIGTTANSDLKLDNVATAASAITINNTNQTLEIGARGALTIGAIQSVASGNILVDGGTITDAAGISFGASGGVIGTLNGFGTVAANLTKVSGAGATIITASGGTLDLTGTFGTGLGAAISTTSASDMRFDSTSTVAALSINNGFQTLEAHSGVLTLTGAQTVSLGKILMSGGTLGDSSGIVLGTGQGAGTLTGFGTVTAAITEAVSSSSLVVASGGTLILGTGIGASSGLSYQIAGAASSVLELDGTVGEGNTFTFLGTAGELAYNNAGGISENIVGLNVGASATPTNFIDYMNHTVTIAGSTAHSGNSGTVNLSDGSVLTLSGVTNAPGAWFVNTKADGAGTDIFLSSVCYAAGTRILTVTGERMVETLQRGDIVLALEGGELSAQPVRWIGQRWIDLAAHPQSETAAPIRILRGAFADNMPHSDLLLSPDHAVFVDGKLICARQLVNGTTIR
jgi:large repetitive protein